MVGTELTVKLTLNWDRIDNIIHKYTDNIDYTSDIDWKRFKLALKREVNKQIRSVGEGE